MFLDERINNQTSKMFSRAILYATLISALYLVVKTYVFGFSFAGSISELFIIVTGAVVLWLDFIKYKSYDSDERLISDRMIYYKKASIAFLGLSLLGFAIAIPIYFLQTNEVPPLNYLLINLEILGFIYFSFQFKKNHIYFNYSFIENEEGYYKNVFKNILKLTILVSGVYGIALFISLVIFLLEAWLITIMISLLIAYLLSLFSLSICYLFISWIEKMTYKSLLNGSKYLKSQIIIGTLYLVFTIVNFYINYLMQTFDPTDMINASEIVANYAYMARTTSLIGQLFMAMLLTNIFLQFKQKIKGIGMMVLAMMLSVITTLLTSNLGYLDVFLEPQNIKTLQLIITYIGLTYFIISTIGLFIITSFFIENNMSKARLIIPVTSIILYIIPLIFSSFSATYKLEFTLIQVLLSLVYVYSIVKITNDKEVLVK